jgi:hypothetical protein
MPRGHHLLLKTGFAIALFAIYSSWIWIGREDFCSRALPQVRELQQKKAQGETLSVETAARLLTDRATQSAEPPRSAETSKEPGSNEAEPVILPETWDVTPRGYVSSAIHSGHLSVKAAKIGLSTYFYLTHGVRVIDTVWRARGQFTPQWGIYEIGVLSPLLRVFLPNNKRLATLEAEQRSALIYGFFPTVWVAAFVDFGLVGAILYVAVWGGMAGWSVAGIRHSGLVTPMLLLVFVLAGILLSPVQGPLGIANSALVLVSMLVTGFCLDLPALRAGPQPDAKQLQPNGSAG